MSGVNNIIKGFQNLEPFSCIDDIPEIPVIENSEDYQIIIDNLIRCGAIPKKNLEIGSQYLGTSRNSSVGTWNGTKFEYNRVKFGREYIDTISHFEDEQYFDVFIPFRIIN